MHPDFKAWLYGGTYGRTPAHVWVYPTEIDTNHQSPRPLGWCVVTVELPGGATFTVEGNVRFNDADRA